MTTYIIDKTIYVTTLDRLAKLLFTLNAQLMQQINCKSTEKYKLEAEVVKGLTSQQTHYRSYQGRVFMGQMTQPTVSKHWRKIES